ncbi:hypothetical protein BDR26DRAFT_589384 [Obelidium mucronatum]|nr:hypothetical protein BDR26DRAFT_589384 [Obelidium mucronatum]
MGYLNNFLDVDGTIQKVAGRDAMSSILYDSVSSALNLIETPHSPLSIHKRNLHLANTFRNFPSVSLLRKASHVYRQVFGGGRSRSRRQSAISMWSVDTDRASIAELESSEPLHTLDNESIKDASPEKRSRPGLQILGGVTRRTRSQSIVSIDESSGNYTGGGGGGSGFSGGVGNGVGSSGVPRGGVGMQSRSRTWFQKSSLTKKKKVIEFDKLGEFELVEALCREIETRGETRAYNNAAIAAATFAEPVVYSRHECITIANRSKSASGFVLALRILLNSEVYDTTFSEYYLLASPIQRAMLETNSIKETIVLKKVCVNTGTGRESIFPRHLPTFE